MPKIDPFKSKIPITEDNFLDIYVIKFKDDNLPIDFNAALELLDQIRDVLLVSKKVGRVPEISARSFYIDALRWLHFEIPLSNFIAVPIISTLDSMDSQTATNFRQYCDTLLTTLRTVPIFLAIEVSMATLKSNIMKGAQQATEELSTRTHEEITSLASSVIDNFNKEIETKATDAGNSFSSEISTAHSTMQNFRNEQISSLEQAKIEISQTKDQAISQFQAAKSLQRWGEVYDDQIAEYKLRINGKSWSPATISRNINSLFSIYIKNKTKHPTFIETWFYFLCETVLIMFKNIMSTLLFWYSKYKSYSGKRFLWFLFISVFVSAFVLITLLSLANITSLHGFDISKYGIDHTSQSYLKLTIYVPIALILGLAYSFAIKNFRIYSNMLDQYEHRRSVAYTSQGIILSLSTDRDSSVRDIVTAAAANALFEQKNTGHLTKSEGESISPTDLLRFTTKN